MTNRDLLKLLLEKVDKKFKTCSEESGIVFQDYLKGKKDIDNFSKEVGKLEAYGDVYSLISDLYRQEILGILDHQEK